METNLEDPTMESTKEPATSRLSWFREQQEAIRKRGNIPIEFKPIEIQGEPLSMTIIRERRSDFDDDPLS
jgi:hypothetical protein